MGKVVEDAADQAGLGDEKSGPAAQRLERRDLWADPIVGSDRRRRLARELQHVTASPRSAGEKGKIEKSWSEVYKLTDTVPVPISDAAMLRYGVSATPTFVFVDRKGIVLRYSPTRMSEERLSGEIEKLLR